MVKKKTPYLIMTISLVVLMLASTMLTVAAQANNQTSGMGAWQPPTSFVNPVTQKIQQLRTQGLSNDQITAELEKQNMGWDEKTGATWLGRTLTAEEQAKMPTSAPTPILSNATTSQSPNIAASLVQKTAVMRTNSYSWTGVSSEITTGSMDVASGQTQNNYLCVQLGDLSGITNWAEAVVIHNVGETYKWYTYDSDEGGGMVYYMDKNTPTTSADTFVIMLDGTQDSYGWKYDVWINYNWVRSGHLSNLFVQGGFQNEAYSNGQYNNDASHAIFYRNWLHNAGGWSYWTNTVPTSWSTTSPMHESHYMSTYSYYWDTWVQN